jgi:hypothetical protein
MKYIKFAYEDVYILSQNNEVTMRVRSNCEVWNVQRVKGLFYFDWKSQ